MTMKSPSSKPASSRPQPAAPTGIFGFLHEFRKRHDRLKKFVHEGMRYPLPPAGRAFMGFVYFCTPVVGGWYVMDWAISKSKMSIGEFGENLPNKTVEGLGNRRVLADGSDQKVGAGGWGGGVRLAVSDEETQKRSQKRVRMFLERQRRLMEGAEDGESPKK